MLPPLLCGIAASAGQQAALRAYIEARQPRRRYFNETAASASAGAVRTDAPAAPPLRRHENCGAGVDMAAAQQSVVRQQKETNRSERAARKQ
jgi:hypothetical protein